MDQKTDKEPAQNQSESSNDKAGGKAESYLVIARKWRPGTFADVVGQRHVVRSLKNAVTMNKIAGAYLFSGMRGVGKTSMARILAKSINCAKGPTVTPCGECDICREITKGSSLDVIEIDGASNNSVAEVRELREQLQYAPVKCRKKVYIIDEVHMLSTAAFNAFLKTLEEPPPHVVFVMATTEMTKIPETVLSRCQCFEFRALTDVQITERLLEIAEKENIALTDAGLRMIARRAEGSMRDAQSLMDQVSAYAAGDVDEETVGMVLGLVSREKIWALLSAVIEKDADAAVKRLHEIYYAGYDAGVLVKEMFAAVRILTITKAASSPETLLDEAADTLKSAGEIASKTSIGKLQLFYEILLKTENRIRLAPNTLSVLEMAVIKMISLDDVVPIDEILQRLRSVGPSPNQTVQAARTERVSNPVSETRATYTPKPRAEDARRDTPSGHAPDDQTPGDPAPGTPDTGAQDPWMKIVSAIKSKKQALGSILEKAVDFSILADQAVIKYRKKDVMFRDRCEKNLGIIESEIEKEFKKKLKLTLVPVEDDSGNGGAKKKTADNETKKELLGDPIVQKAVEIFEGRPGYENETGK